EEKVSSSFGIQLWSSAWVTSLGVVCLPNEEIFAGLARIGYEKPSTKLTFYKAFFSTQWKFFIHTILHSLSAKRTSWNEFSSAMSSALICLSSVRDIAEEAEAQIPAQDDDVQEHAEEEVATDVVSPTPTSPSPSSPIIKLKARVKKLERLNKVKSSKLRCLKNVGTSQRIESSDDVENVFNQGRMSVNIEMDEGIELVVDQEKDAKIEGRHADTQVEIYNIDLDHSSKVAAASTSIPAAKPKVLKIAAAPAVSTRRRKGVVIGDLEEELQIDTPAETPTVKDKGKGILIEDPKPMKKKDQVEMDAQYAKKLQEELDKKHGEAYKNIDWNAAFDHMEKEDGEIIKSINETPTQKAAKRRKLSDEAQEADDLRGRLEIV
nr:hypothetical protein [Tanacetum cinerariifolium]